MKATLRLGTRGSKLALWQANHVRERLVRAHDGLSVEVIIIKTTADGHMVGEDFSAPVNKPPVIQADVSAPNTILRIDIVKDGKYVFTTQSHGRTASIRFQDTDVKPGKSYYYIRVFQTDTENPTGDPEVGWTSPWFVNYQTP